MPYYLKSKQFFSEFFGPGIGGSPQESLGAGWRSCDPADPSKFKSRSPSGLPKLSPKLGLKLLNAKGTLKSRHSLLWRRMQEGSLLLACMPYVTSPQASIMLLHTYAFTFPEYSYIFILFPGTNYHICTVLMQVACVSVGLPRGPRWSLVVAAGCSSGTCYCPSHEF